MLRFPRGAAVLAGLTLLSCACAPRQGEPSIVVVLIDQLRKDTADAHLPRINALAQRGIVFEQMRSAAPWTYPSVISFMTGLYPQQHHADGHPSDEVLTTFARSLPLLPGILRARGYRTAGFVANPFLHTWNPFHEAFDSYSVDFVPSRGNLRGGDEARWNPDTMFANTVNPAILRHFEGTPLSGPEFTYVHYIDVHGPFAGAPFAPGYSQATEYLDEKVAELYAYFMKRYAGDLLFIVTSDHGRALGDDETIGQGVPWRKQKLSTHDFNLRIPFMILPSNQVTRPIRIAEAASNVDFVPTLLAWLGIKPPVALPGVSFLPAIRGGEMPAVDRALYARVSAFGSWTDCIVYRGRKYMRHFDPRGEAVTSRVVFDLNADPREVTPIAAEFGPIDAVFSDAAGNHGLEYAATVEAPSPELEDHLRALGYLDNSTDPKPRP